ncbi:MAG TPA: DUF4258 domain-containing protein [Tepidisphaeraceae bacterium]|jgi:hypothetical protein
MSDLLRLIQTLVSSSEVRISDHGYDELAADGLLVAEVLRGVNAATIVEEYPDYWKGPCILLLQRDAKGEGVHVLWGVPKGAMNPAVLVTAYRPDPGKWESDLLRRKK